MEMKIKSINGRKKIIMYKKGISLFLALAMSLAMPASVFAGTTVYSQKDAVAASTTQGSVTSTSAGVTTTNTAVTTAATTKAIKLSLSDAVKKMQTNSNSAEIATLHKQSDDAVAKGYTETYKTIQEGIDSINSTHTVTITDIFAQYGGALNPASPSDQILAGTIANITNQTIWNTISSARSAGVTSVNKNIMKVRKDFAHKYIDSNYKAEMNQIEYTTVQLYYGVLLAQENVRIGKENVKAKTDILKDTESMKKAGMTSNKELYSAKADLETANSDLAAAQVKLSDAKMKFNYLLDYAVVQDVTFTDTLKELKAPDKSADSYVTLALKSRPEIAGSLHAESVYKMLFDDVSAYTKTSATYLNAQVAYNNAVQTAKTAPTLIEIDVRSQYNNLMAKKEAVQRARKTFEYAQEAYRLTELSYTVGMSTLSNLQNIQVTYHMANLGLSSAITDYDLAVYSFKYAYSVGTTRLPL